MTPIVTDVLSLPLVMGLGLVFGMGPCLIGCLPYLGPVLLSMNGGMQTSWQVLLPLSAGRLSAYIGFAMAAGAAGHTAGAAVGPNTVGIVLGLATALTGIGMLIGKRRRHSCPSRNPVNSPVLPGGLFMLGFGMALTPCAPLSAVLLSAGATGSAMGGLSLGLAFGMGALIVPSLAYGVGAAYFAAKLRAKLATWTPRMELASALLLILSGCINLIRWGL